MTDISTEEPRRHESKSVLDLITLGAEVSGAIAGGGLGFLVGGPAGSMVGAGTGAALARSIDAAAHEVQERVVGPSQLRRIGATLWYTSRAIEARVNSGESFRTDDFVRSQPGDRPSAEEVAEHILIAVQRDPEEKKLKYYGNLLAAFWFEPDIDRAQANFLVRRAGTLSYRQCCILSVLAQKDTFRLRSGNYANPPHDNNVETVLHEIVDLCNGGLVILSQNNSYDVSEATQALLQEPRSVYPARMFVVGTGANLYRLMRLQSIAFEELDNVARLLK